LPQSSHLYEDTARISRRSISRTGAAVAGMVHLQSIHKER
jgi:hypothetical protein